MKSKSLTAVNFRYILAAIMVAIATMMAAIFWFGYTSIQATSIDVGRRQADADASKNTLDNLRRLETRLTELADIPLKAQQLRSSSQFAQFEAERIVRRIANELSLPIDTISFYSSDAQKGPASATGAQISFTLSGGIRYHKFIQLLDALERNTPKLTVNSISIPSGTNRNSINPGTLIITMATE
jgi:hypothetical protein